MRLVYRDIVVLSPDDYRRLDTIRRQAGAQATRVSALRQQLAGATTSLDEITQAVALAECPISQHNESTACLRASVLAILARDASQSAQTVSVPARGSGPPGPR